MNMLYCFFFFIVLITTVYPSCYYVQISTTPGGNGTKESPFSSIEEALNHTFHELELSLCLYEFNVWENIAITPRENLILLTLQPWNNTDSVVVENFSFDGKDTSLTLHHLNLQKNITIHTEKDVTFNDVVLKATDLITQIYGDNVTFSSEEKVTWEVKLNLHATSVEWTNIMISDSNITSSVILTAVNVILNSCSLSTNVIFNSTDIKLNNGIISNSHIQFISSENIIISGVHISNTPLEISDDLSINLESSIISGLSVSFKVKEANIIQTTFDLQDIYISTSNLSNIESTSITSTGTVILENTRLSGNNINSSISITLSSCDLMNNELNAPSTEIHSFHLDGAVTLHGSVSVTLNNGESTTKSSIEVSSPSVYISGIRFLDITLNSNSQSIQLQDSSISGPGVYIGAVQVNIKQTNFSQITEFNVKISSQSKIEDSLFENSVFKQVNRISLEYLLLNNISFQESESVELISCALADVDILSTKTSLLDSFPYNMLTVRPKLQILSSEVSITQTNQKIWDQADLEISDSSSCQLQNIYFQSTSLNIKCDSVVFSKISFEDSSKNSFVISFKEQVSVSETVFNTSSPAYFTCSNSKCPASFNSSSIVGGPDQGTLLLLSNVDPLILNDFKSSLSYPPFVSLTGTFPNVIVYPPSPSRGCSPGYIGFGGLTPCQPCPLGTVPENTISSCVPCPNNHYIEPGQETCSPCPKNTFNNQDLPQYFCTPCPNSEYRDPDKPVCEKSPDPPTVVNDHSGLVTPIIIILVVTFVIFLALVFWWNSLRK